MPKFRYEAQQSDGRVVQGMLDEATVGAAIDRLQSAELTILSIAVDKEQTDGAPSSSLTESNEVSSESNPFLANVDRILSDSARLRTGLEAVAQESVSPQMTAKVHRLIEQLESKTAAREFLNREENLEWLPVLVSSREDESDGARWREMLKLIETEQRSHWTWREFAYPALLLFGSLVVLVIMQINIIYPFSQLFRSFGLQLPPPTLLLIRATELCVHYPWQVMLGLLLVTTGIILAIRWWRMHALTTRWFGLAIAGNTSSVRAMSRFVRLIADALCLEATLPQALRIAGRGCGHAHFRDMASRLAQTCEQDAQSIADSTVAHNFPPTMWAALTASSSSSQTIDMLRSLSQMYEDRVIHRRPLADGVWGPIALGLVGLFIAFVILAVFTPLVQMITSLA